MANIMKSGDSESKIFRPRAEFGVSVRPDSGSISGNWYLQHSADNTNWVNSHEDPFSTSKQSGIFKVPDGFYCKVAGGSGTNLVVDIGYTDNQLIKAIDNDIIN